MKVDEIAALANHSATVDNVSRFEVTEIGSITVQANLLLTAPQGGRAAVALRVFPDDDRFAILESMLRDHATTKKTEAVAALSAVGITVEVDQAHLDAVMADTNAAKSKIIALKARNAAKAMR